MKKLTGTSQVVSALGALAAFFTAIPAASALDFVWLSGPQQGQAFAGGGIQIKAINYDTGALYGGLPINTAIGFGQGGTGTQTVEGGIATLNAAQTRPALGSIAGHNDSWGILRITSIQATASNGVLHDIYNAVLPNTPELTAKFWGVNDFYVKQISAGEPGFAGSGQIIDGAGLRVDIYSDMSRNFNQTGGPNAAAGLTTYPTATDGTLELSLLSTPGFINVAGNLGGIATEFESNTANTGYAALNVVGGASAAQFDTNAVGFGGSYGATFQPGLAGQTAHDVFFKFTSSQGVNGWDITSNDPMIASIRTSVPDAGSSVVMLGLGLLCLAAGYRRTRKV